MLECRDHCAYLETWADFSQASLLPNLCPEDAFREPAKGALCASWGTCSTPTLLVVTLVSVALVPGTGGNGAVRQRPGCRIVGCSPEPVLTYPILWPGVEIPPAEQCGSGEHLQGQLRIIKSVPRECQLHWFETQ